MALQSAEALTAFQWTPQPHAAQFVHELVEAYCSHCEPAAQLRQRLLQETGTRLADWIDHLVWPASVELDAQLRNTGYVPGYLGDSGTWSHHEGLFPRIRTREAAPYGMALRVESVADYLKAAGLFRQVKIEGDPLAPLRRACLFATPQTELWIYERHGDPDYKPRTITAEQADAVEHHLQQFHTRRRDFATDAEGFAEATRLVRDGVADLGVDWTCSLFFRAERDYWQGRNHAAQVQKARQDALGLGWGNHDHHTYRSSRECFAPLVALMELLGLECRERFYAGREAGWGAQVMEQPRAGVIVFADVDLAPHEVADDFAHVPLAPQAQLGTVGLWCKLHGEAMLQAGMHHLEAQFDYAAAREQLQAAGVESMPPFTNFPFLKQCFTQGEIWPVRPERLDALSADGRITSAQAEKFRTQGALGSHLEILERNEGYKGFNQTGISEIILATDPRKR